MAGETSNARFGRRLAAARLALWWEALWPALWPGLGVAGLFVALAWAGVIERLPATIHAMTLGLFGLWLLWAWRRVPEALALPARERARRRLETDNAVPHRALEVLDDSLGLDNGDDPMTHALWHSHRARAAARVDGLRVKAPSPELFRHDPYALRAAVILALVVTGVAAGPLAASRLGQALVPHFGRGGAGGGGEATGFTAWITPPGYTRLPPVYLGAQGAAPGLGLRVPAGASVIARLYGTVAGAIAIDDEARDLEQIEPGTFAGETTVTAGSLLRLLDDGSELAAWPIEVIADAPPTVGFPAPLGASERRSLRIAFEAHDDYGVASVALRLRLGGPGRPGVEPLVVVPLGGSTGRPEAKGTVFKDLTAHPWAGLDVIAELTATDAIGQVARSAPVTIALPERNFRNPVARAVIAQRKRLVANPTQRRAVAQALAGIADEPQAYGGRLAVFLALDVATITLVRHAAPETDAAMVDLLWDLALDLEEGRVAGAEAALRAAQEALEQALQNGASDAEIARLMDDLRAAMSEYLQAMTEEAMRRGIDPDAAQAMPNGQMITSEDLARMLDEAQRAAESGSREEAQRMLSDLREMLENLQAMQSMMEPGSQAQSMNQGLNELGQMLRQQQQLRDRAFAEQQRQQGDGAMPGEQGQPRPGQGSQPGQGGQPGRNGQPGGMGQMAADQEALRQQLGDLLRQLGEAGVPLPDALARADQAMGQAQGALEGNNPGAAAQAQGEALSALREGMGALSEEMARQLGTDPGQGPAAKAAPAPTATP
ncbi:TIGR02302 family protein [Oleomonas cavernae]|uniref:TIGR02302 family protein n=1 Tax=Oleomonas cavernae TaxID=2320859 RepID=A0A418VUB1_9PROT|nr:TIGR02302 family protein [Oleomonas cavernae]RJF80714.1 TIGR02302 family protein [Oleomonas cavernae]